MDVSPMAFYGRDLLVSQCHGRWGHLDCNGWCANERPETSFFANAALQRGRVDMSPTSTEFRKEISSAYIPWKIVTIGTSSKGVDFQEEISCFASDRLGGWEILL